MDAMNQFAGRVRAWVVAAAGSACAVGCVNPMVNEPASRMDGADAAPAQQPPQPVARPQAPDTPSQPPAPIVPADPNQPVPTPPPVAGTPAAGVITPASAAVVSTVPDLASTRIRVAAVIGSDTVITDDEVWMKVRRQMGMIANLAATNPDLRPDKEWKAERQKAVERMKEAERDRGAWEKELYREQLRILIERELILTEFVAKIKKSKPGLLDELKEDTSRQAAKQMREFKKNFPSEDVFNQWMKAQGVSYKVWVRDLERNNLKDMYLGQMMREKGVRQISIGQTLEYYRTHEDEFRIDDKVQWLDLFVLSNQFATPDDARKYAEDLLRQLKGGADFGEVAKKYGHGFTQLSGGKGVGEKRGEIAPVELEPAVFSLAANELSGLIPTATGFHILKVTERQVAGVRPFDDKVQTVCRAKVAEAIYKQEYTKMIDELWRKSTVKIIEP